MLKKQDVITEAWSDYELIDSGAGRKLERFGSVVTDRPDTQAIWEKGQVDRWAQADTEFEFAGKEGCWDTKGKLPEPWVVDFNEAKFLLRQTNFKHVGLFPEHAAQWQWVTDRVGELPDTPQVLNLFGYTGAASVVAAKAGAKVTHVDASKQSVTWANENTTASNLPDDAVRWIVDDVTAFVRREVKRGNKYEGIILDPPAFGRGAKGQVWHIEEDLLPLLEMLPEILSDTPGSFVVLSGYAAGYAPEVFAQVVEGVFGDKIDGTFGALHIKETDTKRLLPTGIYVRFVN